MSINNAGKGIFSMKLTLVGDTKFISDQPIHVLNNAMTVVFDNDGEFIIATTGKQPVKVLLVGAGESASQTAGGAAGESIEKTLELKSGTYFVNIGNPELNGKTNLGVVDNGSHIVFLSARGGAEMKKIMQAKQIKICSIEQWNALAAKGGFEVGMKIQDSPVGPGEFTDINDRGYPRVNHVAVTNMITEEGAIYGDYIEMTKKREAEKAKENNNEISFYYKNPEMTDQWWLEGFGPLKDAKFGERYKVPLTWEIRHLPLAPVSPPEGTEWIDSDKGTKYIRKNGSWASNDAVY